MRFIGFVRSIRACHLPQTRNILQLHYFQHDFIARDPKAKLKRYKYPLFYNPYGPRPPPSDKIVQLAELIATLPPEERRQIGRTLGEKLKHLKLQSISADDIELGSQEGAAGVAAKAEEQKAEKTAFNVKLETFDAAAKIKVIKEIGAFTNLGLKEAKDLVEKA